MQSIEKSEGKMEQELMLSHDKQQERLRESKR
jgi:hypothetical protein